MREKREPTRFPNKVKGLPTRKEEVILVVISQANKSLTTIEIQERTKHYLGFLSRGNLDTSIKYMVSKGLLFEFNLGVSLDRRITKEIGITEKGIKALASCKKLSQELQRN
jgi:DNA-binding PadR family transcriptional regulator